MGVEKEKKNPNQSLTEPPTLSCWRRKTRATLARHGSSRHCKNTDWNHSTSCPQTPTAPVLIEKTRRPHQGFSSGLIIRKTSPLKNVPTEIGTPGRESGEGEREIGFLFLSFHRPFTPQRSRVDKTFNYQRQSYGNPAAFLTSGIQRNLSLKGEFHS